MLLRARARRSICRSSLAIGLIGALMPLAALAQANYPERAIALVVPFGAGGIADSTARAVAESMSVTLKQPVVVDNRPSAGSIVASQTVANAKPDGYTLLLMSNGNAVSVGLFKKLPYDTVKAFAPVSTLGSFDLGVFVASPSRFKTLGELLAHAKAKPGDVKVGTIAIGSTQHLAAQLFQTTAGVDLLSVPYKTSGAVTIALRGGEIDMAMEIVGPMVPQVTAGAVRALAVTGDRPNAALASVPTVQQSGVKGYDVTSWNAIAAPAGTPDAVIQRLHDAIQVALASPKVKATLEPLGMRLEGSTPAKTQALLESEIKRWGDVIKAANIPQQ